MQLINSDVKPFSVLARLQGVLGCDGIVSGEMITDGKHTVNLIFPEYGEITNIPIELTKEV